VEFIDVYVNHRAIGHAYMQDDRLEGALTLRGERRTRLDGARAVPTNERSRRSRTGDRATNTGRSCTASTVSGSSPAWTHSSTRGVRAGSTMTETP